MGTTLLVIEGELDVDARRDLVAAAAQVIGRAEAKLETTGARRRY
jgi:hypothetical protein